MAKQGNLLFLLELNKEHIKWEIHKVQLKMKSRFPYTILLIVCNSKTFVQYYVDFKARWSDNDFMEVGIVYTFQKIFSCSGKVCILGSIYYKNPDSLEF